MTRLGKRLARNWLSVALATILLGLTLDCAMARHGFRDLLVLRREQVQLERNRESLLAIHDRLARRVDLLKSNDHCIQSLIRRELGYVRPGEIVYRFSSSPNAGVSWSSAAAR